MALIMLLLLKSHSHLLSYLTDHPFSLLIIYYLLFIFLRDSTFMTPFVFGIIHILISNSNTKWLRNGNANINVKAGALTKWTL